eukprot:COSAG02_NODE_10969_length_1822_cov_1.059779_2_plen_40_part_00
MEEDWLGGEPYESVELNMQQGFLLKAADQTWEEKLCLVR